MRLWAWFCGSSKAAFLQCSASRASSRKPRRCDRTSLCLTVLQIACMPCSPLGLLSRCDVLRFLPRTLLRSHPALLLQWGVVAYLGDGPNPDNMSAQVRTADVTGRLCFSQRLPHTWHCTCASVPPCTCESHSRHFSWLHHAMTAARNCAQAMEPSWGGQFHACTHVLDAATALQAKSTHSLLNGALILLAGAAKHDQGVVEALASSPGMQRRGSKHHWCMGRGSRASRPARQVCWHAAAAVEANALLRPLTSVWPSNHRLLVQRGWRPCSVRASST